MLTLKEILNFNILSQFRDKNEIIEYLKNNNFNEKDLQILIDKFKNENNNLHNLTLEQLDQIAAGTEQMYIIFSRNLNQGDRFLFDNLVQRTAYRQNRHGLETQISNLIRTGKLNEDNCTFQYNGSTYVYFPNNFIVPLTENELKIFVKKTKMGVNPQIAAAYALNGIIESIPKIEYSLLASVTNSFMSWENGGLVIKYKSLDGEIFTQDNLIDIERKRRLLYG